MKRLSGIVIPLVTPLTEEDTVDVESLKRLTDYCIDGGMTKQMIYHGDCGWRFDI